MYCEYYYKTYSSAIDILTDLKSLLTGETNINNLSSSCEKNYTYLNTSLTPAGWTLVDDKIETNNYFVISAPLSDDQTKEKIVKIRFLNPYLYLELGLDYDLNTGNLTYKAYNSDNYNYSQLIDLESGGLLAITASSNHIGILSVTNTYNIGSISYNSPIFVSEFTRESEWDTPSTNPGIPVVWFNAGYNSGFSPNLYFPTSTGFSYNTGYDARFLIEGYPYQDRIYYVSDALYNQTLGDPIVVDPNDNTKKAYQTIPIYATPADGNIRTVNKGGLISPKCDVWIFAANTGSPFDRIQTPQKTFVIWPFYDTRRLLVNGG